jgi:hypothetical protein
LRVPKLRLQDIDLKKIIPREQIEESIKQLDGLTGHWDSTTVPARMPIRGRVIAMQVGLADRVARLMLVWVREVSAGGRKLILTEELKTQSLLILGTRASTQPNGIYWELTQVRNRTEEGKGHILHGVQVIREVSAGEIEKVLAGDKEAMAAVCKVPEEKPAPTPEKV